MLSGAPWRRGCGGSVHAVDGASQAVVGSVVSLSGCGRSVGRAVAERGAGD
jgi:hypothetical protein